MGESFIKGLTTFIDNNRQEIRTTLMLSTIMTASIMALIAFHPFIHTLLTFAWSFLINLIGNVLSFINTAISQIVYIACTILLALIFSIKLSAIILLNIAMILWAIISVIADATSIGNQYIAATVEGWISSVTGFLSLPLLEMANKTIDTIGFIWTSILVFVLLSVTIYTSRNSPILLWIMFKELLLWVRFIFDVIIMGKPADEIHENNRGYISQITPMGMAIIKEYRDSKKEKEASE